LIIDSANFLTDVDWLLACANLELSISNVSFDAAALANIWPVLSATGAGSKALTLFIGTAAALLGVVSTFLPHPPSNSAANDIATVANCIFIDRLPDHPLSERQPSASKLVPMGAFFATRRLVMIEPSHGGQEHGHLQ
jgi:hypothetical protein